MLLTKYLYLFIYIHNGDGTFQNYYRTSDFLIQSERRGQYVLFSSAVNLLMYQMYEAYPLNCQCFAVMQIKIQFGLRCGRFRRTLNKDRVEYGACTTLYARIGVADMCRIISMNSVIMFSAVTL